MTDGVISISKKGTKKSKLGGQKFKTKRRIVIIAKDGIYL